jgi:hypothetical protein
MHDLRVIVNRNAYAAGRELGHAIGDGREIRAADRNGRGWSAPSDDRDAMLAFSRGAAAGEAESGRTFAEDWDSWLESIDDAEVAA